MDKKPSTAPKRRKHLTSEECERLIKAASKSGRYGHRDATMVLLAWTHGLRVSELVNVQRNDINLPKETFWVNRLKGSTSGDHPLRGREVRNLKRLYREWPDSPFVFVSERGEQMDRRNFAKILARLSVPAKLGFEARPHMLRHACGYTLANQGTDTRLIQAWLGHVNIQHTVLYTELSPTRFKGLWKD